MKVVNTNHPFHNTKKRVVAIKPPIFKENEAGIPLPYGYLVFSVDEGNNNIYEYNAECDQNVFLKVIQEKLWRNIYLKIDLIFDSKGKVVDINIISNPPTAGYEFELTPEDKEKYKYDGDMNTSSISSDSNNEVIFKVLDKANADGMFVEVKSAPENLPKVVLADILEGINKRVSTKETIETKSIINDKYIVNNVSDSGTYIYVNPKSL